MDSPFDVLSEKVRVSEKSGSVSTEIFLPQQPVCLVTLAHGAGTNMHHSFMVDLAGQLANKQIATARFNFPYTEIGKKMPDRPPVATATIEAVVDRARSLFPSLPIFLGGKSFGGRMSSHFISKYPGHFASGLVFFGFPLHSADIPSVDRAKHLENISKPMLFLQGTADKLAYIDLIEQVVDSLTTATLVKIDRADHSFRVGKRIVIDVLAEETATWVKNHI